MFNTKTCSRCGKRVWLLNSKGKTVLIEPYEIYIVPNRHLEHRFMNAGGVRTGGRETTRGEQNAVPAYREHRYCCNGDYTYRQKPAAAKTQRKTENAAKTQREKTSATPAPAAVQGALFDYNDMSVRCVYV